MRTTPVLAILLAASVICLPVLAQDHDYVGTKNCRKCHIKQWKSWSETKMSQAFESLKPGVDTEVKEQLGLDPQADYTADEACVSCHVTGWGKASGFTSVEDTPELAGIGCEACHGAGGTYTQDGYMTLKNKEYKRADLVGVGLTDPIDESVCVQCHNEDVPIPDYTFDFATKKIEGTHASSPLKYDHD